MSNASGQRGGQAAPGMPAPRIDSVAVVRIPERTIDGRVAGFEVTIVGAGFYGTAFGPFVKFNHGDAVAVILDSDTRITAYAPPDLRGTVEVDVENPDHLAARTKVAFR